MCLESDLELPNYKTEEVQAAQEMRHQTRASSDPSHVPAKACQAWKEGTATKKERRGTRYTTWSQKFHHYCFAREVSIITDHKPQVAIIKKDITTLTQKIQCILLRIHQY